MDKETQSIADDVIIGENTLLGKFINLYGCTIGDESKVGPFVEIQKGATIGNQTKIQSHTFICEGVHIGNCCFIGHGVIFIYDNQPRSVSRLGNLETDDDWKDRLVETIIEDKVSIGSNATILGGVKIGKGALIGAGSVVTKDVAPGEIWVGNPAKKLKDREIQHGGDNSYG